MASPPEVTIATTMGEITFELYEKEAPKTCKNFIELAQRGYYDNVKVRNHPRLFPIKHVSEVSTKAPVHLPVL